MCASLLKKRKAEEQEPIQCPLQTLADLCDALRRQEEEAYKNSSTIKESSVIADECLRKYLNRSQDEEMDKIEGNTTKNRCSTGHDDESATEYEEEIDCGGLACPTTEQDHESLSDEDEFYKLTPQYRSVDTQTSTASTIPSQYGSFSHSHPQSNIATPHFLYPDIPRILKRDIRRKYSFMFANVMNSYNSQLVDAFLKKFATPDIIYYYKIQIPGITGRDFDVLSLQGVEFVSAFLCSLQLLFPDFLLEVKETKLKQTLPSLETRVISRFRFYATFLYDLDTLTLGALVKRGYTLSCSSTTCPLTTTCPTMDYINTALNTQFHHCSLLKGHEGLCPNTNHTPSSTSHEESMKENSKTSKDTPIPLTPQKQSRIEGDEQSTDRSNSNPLTSPPSIKTEEVSSSSEENHLLPPTTPEELNKHMKLRSRPKYCDLEGVLYFQINEMKKIQKIIFVARKRKCPVSISPMTTIPQSPRQGTTHQKPPTPAHHRTSMKANNNKKK